MGYLSNYATSNIKLQATLCSQMNVAQLQNMITIRRLLDENEDNISRQNSMNLQSGRINISATQQIIKDNMKYPMHLDNRENINIRNINDSTSIQSKKDST